MMTYELLVDNFRRHLKACYFNVTEDASYLILKENKGRSYQVKLNISRDTSKFVIIKDLEDLKNNDAGYSKEPPKDCDYIIIDWIKKEVLFIELKDTDETNAALMAQLIAGEKWLAHLLFCTRNLLPDFTQKKVAIRYDREIPLGRRGRRAGRNGQGANQLKEVSGGELFVLRGNEFNIDQIR